MAKPNGAPDAQSACDCTALRKATRRISQLYDTALSASGLKVTQRALLAQINRSGPITIGGLASALVMDAGALAHTLKPLARDGLVTIEIDPRDRRNRIIGLTSQGQAKLAETNAAWEAAQSRFETALGPAQTDTLRHLMQFLVSDRFMQQFEGDTAPSPRPE